MIARTLNIEVLEELSENMTIDQLVDHLTEIVKLAEEVQLRTEDNSNDMGSITSDNS